MPATDRQRAWMQNEGTDADTQLLPSGNNSVYRGYESPVHNGRYAAENSSASQETNQLSTRHFASIQWEGSREQVGTTSDKNPCLRQKAKVIQSSSLRPAIKQILLFQLPALAFTSALLVLYAKKVHWNPTANQLGALLVAAKVHETLIITSSFHILYYHIRRGLLGRGGIPLGFLTAPFQLTSPFYIVSSEFWSGVRAIGPQSTLLAVLVLVTFTLNTLVGASSGILVLPKPAWQTLSLQEALELANGSVAGYAASYPTDLFPSVIDLSTAPPFCLYSDYTTSNGVARCPFNDLVIESTAIYTYFDDVYSWPKLYGTNLTIAYMDKRSISFWSNSTESSLFFVATVPLSCVESIFSLTNGDSWFRGPQKDLRYITNQHGALKLTAELRANGETVSMKQPRVITQCSQPSQIQGSESVSPQYEFIMNQTFYHAFNLTVPASMLHYPPDNSRRFGFIDGDKYLPENVRASTAIWIQDSYGATLCLVDARWLEADTWSNTLDTSSTISHSLPIDSIEKTSYVDLDAESFIYIDPSWCYLLNQTLYDYAKGDDFSLFERLFVPLDTPTSVASKLTIVLADALSTVPNNHVWHIERSSIGSWRPVVDIENYIPEGIPPFSEISNPEDYLILSVGFYHNVYTYNFNDTTTILSWIVLLLHYLLALIHILVLIVHRGETSESWGRLGELLCLAVNSQPTDLLTNTGAGVTGKKIWGINASVREAGSRERVELVLRDGEPPDYHMLIRQDRLYG